MFQSQNYRRIIYINLVSYLLTACCLCPVLGYHFKWVNILHDIWECVCLLLLPGPSFLTGFLGLIIPTQRHFAHAPCVTLHLVGFQFSALVNILKHTSVSKITVIGFQVSSQSKSECSCNFSKELLLNIKFIRKI